MASLNVDEITSQKKFQEAIMAATLTIDYSLKAMNKARIETEEKPWIVTPAAISDKAEIKSLFLKLHDFNSSLDPRFAFQQTGKVALRNTWRN